MDHNQMMKENEKMDQNQMMRRVFSTPRRVTQFYHGAFTSFTDYIVEMITSECIGTAVKEALDVMLG
ncbi:hypothetical protein MSG28_008193 [Choristoneura fumiferana]|uniref:Uncharacterized protein n=1 Tax=Choristoneura fumiferana TaxID=7141 RepID=A0ACC0JAB3_CHOFU|nr:hypothetical protein MSG28_008193 [Choristoneura fumiferana]